MSLKSLVLLPFLAIPALAQQPGVVPPMTFPTPSLQPKTPFTPNFIVPTTTVQLIGPCPVSLSVRSGGTPGSVQVARVGSAGRMSVHVRLTALDTRTMSHLTVAVIYRVFPSGYMTVGSPNGITTEKTFELEANGTGVVDRNLPLDGHIEIQRVRVLSVAFTDGTRWKSEAPNACSSKPSRYVAIATR